MPTTYDAEVYFKESEPFTYYGLKYPPTISLDGGWLIIEQFDGCRDFINREVVVSVFSEPSES
jgi:hypothetical protein